MQVEGVGGLGVHAHVVDQLLQGLEQVGVVLLVIFDQFAQGVIGETAQVAAVCTLELIMGKNAIEFLGGLD